MKTQLVIIAGVLASAQVTAGSPAQYNFDYRSAGETRLRPVQVFSDATSTYFQFPSKLAEIPSIFVTGVSGAEQVLVPKKSGPYWVVESTGDQFLLRYRSLVAGVAKGTSEMPTLAAPARALAAPGGVPVPAAATKPVYGLVAAVDPAATMEREVESVGWIANKATVRIDFETDSTALSKVAKKAIAAALEGLSAQEISSVKIIGRDDQNYGEGIARKRAEAIQGAVIRFGVPASRVSLEEGAPVRAGKGERSWQSDLVITRAIGVSPGIATANRSAERGAAVAAGLRSVNAGLGQLTATGAIDPAFGSELQSRLRGYVESSTTQPTAGVSSQRWVLEPGGTLKDGITVWARASGFKLNWLAASDWPVEERISVTGTLQQAVQRVVGLTAADEKPLDVPLFEGDVLTVRSKAK